MILIIATRLQLTKLNFFPNSSPVYFDCKVHFSICLPQSLPFEIICVINFYAIQSQSLQPVLRLHHHMIWEKGLVLIFSLCEFGYAGCTNTYFSKAAVFGKFWGGQQKSATMLSWLLNAFIGTIPFSFVVPAPDATSWAVSALKGPILLWHCSLAQREEN